jgi:hypothetical protein
MPIETAEAVYTWVRVGVAVLLVVTIGYLYRNFSRNDLFSRPELRTRGQLKNVIGFARMTMKHTSPSSVRHKDAKRRHDAAQAELNRRFGAEAGRSSAPA